MPTIARGFAKTTMVEPFKKQPSNNFLSKSLDGDKRGKLEEKHTSQYFKSLQQARDLEKPPDKDLRNTKMGVTLRFSMPDVEEEFCEAYVHLTTVPHTPLTTPPSH